jgi:hypothetical protein
VPRRNGRAQATAQGWLVEAYSLGGPGAVLIFDDAQAPIDGAPAALPLVQAGLIDTEIINLHPFAGLAT